MDEDGRSDRDDERRKRREEQEKKQKMLLLLLGFACLIQLFVSLQASRDLASRWTLSREEETRSFDKRIRESGGSATQAAPGAGP